MRSVTFHRGGTVGRNDKTPAIVRSTGVWGRSGRRPPAKAGSGRGEVYLGRHPSYTSLPEIAQISRQTAFGVVHAVPALQATGWQSVGPAGAGRRWVRRFLRTSRNRRIRCVPKTVALFSAVCVRGREYVTQGHALPRSSHGQPGLAPRPSRAGFRWSGLRYEGFQLATFPACF